MKEISTLKKCIIDSTEYKEYKDSMNILSKDKEIMELINKIRTMQKLATKMEIDGDANYYLIDEEIDGYRELLEGVEKYINYIDKREIFINKLGEIRNIIEEYINSII